MIMTGTDVYILGAGCSVAAGYPLAASMRQRLEEFGESVAGTSPNVAAWSDETVQLMLKHGAETLDDLSESLLTGVAQATNEDSVQYWRAAYSKIRNAKAAVEAMFLSLESHALETGLQPYRAFLDEILPLSGDHADTIFCTSKARILSFNYDRLFEYAFSRRFYSERVGDALKLHGPLFLNSGLTLQSGRPIFKNDRFTLLKMHGSVGITLRPRFSSRNEVEFWPRKLSPITPESWDLTVGRRDKKTDSIVSNPALIHFPIEKAKALSDSEKEPHPDFHERTFIEEVWKQAFKVMGEASRLFLVGFSGTGKDSSYLARLLSSAPKLESIHIYDPSAEMIKIRLERLSPSSASKIHARWCSFWT
jgi:hypothetical protein